MRSAPWSWSGDDDSWEDDQPDSHEHHEHHEHVEQDEQLAYGIRLSCVAGESIDWLSRGRLATGKLTVLDGDPGIGKTTTALEWAARISRGDALPDGPVPAAPRGVVVMSAEDGVADTIRPRAEAAGADLNRMAVLNERPDGSLIAIPDDLGMIAEALWAMDAALLIIDPFVAFLSGARSAHSDQDVRRALAPLRAMAEEERVAVILIRHLNKASSANALYRGGGSIGIVGAARFGLLAAPDPDCEGRFLIASTKCNLAKPAATLRYHLESVAGTDVARVVWDGTSPLSANGILASAIENEAEQGALGDAQDFLRTLLADGPLPAKEVQTAAKEEGISAATLRRARQRVCAKPRKDGSGGWMWALKPSPATGTHDAQGAQDAQDAQGAAGERLGNTARRAKRNVSGVTGAEGHAPSADQSAPMGCVYPGICGKRGWGCEPFRMGGRCDIPSARSANAASVPA